MPDRTSYVSTDDELWDTIDRALAEAVGPPAPSPAVERLLHLITHSTTPRADLAAAIRRSYDAGALDHGAHTRPATDAQEGK